MLKKRKIVISGAGGKIGQALIAKILHDTDWEIIVFSSSILSDSNYDPRLIIYHNNDILKILSSLKDVDTCVHLAFSRRFSSNADIALSLDFSLNFYKAVRLSGSRLINISTVGIYGQRSDFPDESYIPSPESLYAMAKYASEVLMESVFEEYKKDVTNVRLSGIAQSQRILPVFIERAKHNFPIEIKGGNQEFSWIDMSDAIEAIMALIRFDGKWEKIYNVSLNKKRYSILKLAEMVAVAAETKGLIRTPIHVIQTEEKPICVGWNSERFIDDTGWYPKKDITETIENMF